MSETKITTGIYRHFRGGIYEVICLAKDSETLGETVVYKNLLDEEKIWVRPASMWFDAVEYGGKVQTRFTFIAADRNTLDSQKHFQIIEDIFELFEMYDRFSNNNSLGFYDKEAEKVIKIPYGAVAVAEGDCSEEDIGEYERSYIAQTESILTDSDRYITIPNDGLIDEYNLMEDFADEVPCKFQSQLENALHRKGAFRRFKETVSNLNILEDWYLYRNMRIRREIRLWCDVMNIDWSKTCIE